MTPGDRKGERVRPGPCPRGDSSKVGPVRRVVIEPVTLVVECRFARLAEARFPRDVEQLEQRVANAGGAMGKAGQRPLARKAGGRPTRPISLPQRSFQKSFAAARGRVQQDGVTPQRMEGQEARDD